MGLLSSTLLSLLQITGIFLVIAFFPGYLPDLKFVYEYMEVPLPLEGPLKENHKLNNAKRLFENKIKGPENLEVYNDEVYMSVHGGEILKLSNRKLSRVLKIGKPCAGIWEESLCGRPLGFKIDKSGTLYIADAYYGIISMNLSSGVYKTLVPTDQTIDGKFPMLPNSLDIARDKSIYWTDSSTTHHLEDAIYIFLASGTGRLLKYDPLTKKNEILLSDLHFPNGVVLSSDENFLIVAETGKSRIWKYYLNGRKAGKKEIFIDRLPGFPDNIKKNGEKGFVVSLINPIKNNTWSFSYLYQFPTVRRMIANTLAIFESIIEITDSIMPNVNLKKAKHLIGHLESLNFLYDNHVIIIFLDQEGNIVNSLHGTDGSVRCVSDIVAFQDRYLLGSPYNPYLAEVKLK